MTSKPETRLRNSILKRLEAERPGYWRHCHGNVFTPSGIPDIWGCYRGLFFGFEVKTPGGGDATDLQEFNLNQIRQSGGVAAVIRSYDEARELIDEAVKSRSSKGRCRPSCSKGLSRTDNLAVRSEPLKLRQRGRVGNDGVE